jgi:YHS domain-containing protein
MAMSTHSRSSRRNFIASSALVALTALTAVGVPQFAHAYDELSTSSLNIDAKGVALKGYDPVSYFTSGGPVQGKSDLSEKHEGAAYWFASAGNRDTFKANPARYTPAYGGFCAMGVALDQKLDVNPLLWRVVDGKLYLNVHKEAQARWLEDVKGNLAQADKNWPRIKDRAPNTL